MSKNSFKPFILVDRFRVEQFIGDGAFGTVYKGILLETKEVVAIKKFKKKFYSWDDCMGLIELKALKKLNHENVIQLKEVIKVNNELYFVFDYLPQNLYQQYKKLKKKR